MKIEIKEQIKVTVMELIMNCKGYCYNGSRKGLQGRSAGSLVCILTLNGNWTLYP